MDYIKEAFNRTDLRQIRQFLLYGTDEFECEQQSYRDRLTKGCNPIYARLDDAYPDQAERDKAAADLSQALSAYESVYMEVGMKAGARLIYQLLLTEDTPPAEKE